MSGVNRTSKKQDGKTLREEGIIHSIANTPRELLNNREFAGAIPLPTPKSYSPNELTAH